MPETPEPHPSLRRIAISGASGLLGAAVGDLLRDQGREVVPLVRPRSDGSGQAREGIPWDPANGRLSADDLEGIDAVVHLAGESIFGMRWTDAKKERILDSRVRGTRLVAETLASLDSPPPVLVCASAVGFYGDREDELLDEESTKGEGFLADVCWRWEGAAAAAREAGIRTVHLRFGVILTTRGGALDQMLPPFRAGVGGKLGSGRQWMSWIHLDDAARAVAFALDQESLSGPVNAVAPEPVRNRQLTRRLGKILGRPTLVPVPRLALRLALGEMGEELLLYSARVRPGRLQEAGFEFRHPELESALRAELG